MSLENTRVILLGRPEGAATPEHFAVEVDRLGELEAGKVRIGVEFIFVDAGTRTMLRGEGFHRQVNLGQTILADGVGGIIESNEPGWDVGQAAGGPLGARTIATRKPSALEFMYAGGNIGKLMVKASA